MTEQTSSDHPVVRQASTVDIGAALTAVAARLDQTLDQLLPRPAGLKARVDEAMRYAVFAGGKRLRPFLVLEASRLFGVPEDRALMVAAAIECLHTYSLVHDDLPCMDDDDLRRGQPTTHRKFDEATAVLAGDALLTFAFELLSRPETHPSPAVRCALVALLAQAAGSAGMVGGQAIDMAAEANPGGFDAADTVLLQRLKTGALFEFSCQAGALLGEAGPEHGARLKAYAEDLGLAFQIADDLIDATGDAATAGKAVGKDQERGKATLVSLYGIDGARAEAGKLAERAVATLSAYGAEADLLRALPVYLLDRTA